LLLSVRLLAFFFQADLAASFCPPVCLLSPFRRTSLPLSVRLFACFLLSGGLGCYFLSACSLAFSFQADLATPFCPPVCLLSSFRRTAPPLSVRLLACFLLSGGPCHLSLSACLLAFFFQADFATPFCPPACLLSPFRRTSLPLTVRQIASCPPVIG